MISKLRDIALWFDDRLQVSKVWNATAGHHIPKSSASWFYVFGSATMICFMIQVLTGICLALIYQPSAEEAYSSLLYLNYEQPLGWLLRGMHYWGSNFMVAIMLMHMTQVFMFGAYKYPRELTWVSGVILCLLTLGMAFTGQVMRWDQDAYWGLGIGVAIMGRVPILGPEMTHMLLGGPIIGGETLSRFFTLHVFVIPGGILALLSLHLRMVLNKGINEYPEVGKPVVKETYVEEYEAQVKKDGTKFFPDAIGKDLVFGGIVIGLIVMCAILFGPKGPEGIPDPTLIDASPRPDWPFMWIFALAALMPPYMETVVLLVGPVIGIGLMIALPFYDNVGEKKWTIRPVSVLVVIMAALSLGTLTWYGVTSPWSPEMDAWSSEPTPSNLLEGRTPLELQGAMVLQYKQCRNCHSLEGIGGKRGPDLTEVADRLTHDQLVRQVVQGGGNMPAYGQNLSPAEIAALVAFMETLHADGRLPAQRATNLQNSDRVPSLEH